MVVLCATWKKAQKVYFLLNEIVQHCPAVRVLLMYGASGDRDTEVITLKLELMMSVLFLENCDSFMLVLKIVATV